MANPYGALSATRLSLDINGIVHVASYGTPAQSTFQLPSPLRVNTNLAKEAPPHQLMKSRVYASWPRSSRLPLVDCA
eukprot:7123050-Karenia_brevis.AAC.1